MPLGLGASSMLGLGVRVTRLGLSRRSGGFRAGSGCSWVI